MPATTISTITKPAMPLPPLSEGAKSLPVTTRPSTTSAACTTKPASEFSTPELAATAIFKPCFWKKRITSAVVATVPPTRPVKLLANCSPTTGLNGSGVETAPIMATACGNGGTNDSMNATTTQPHSASSKVVDQSMSASWPINR